MPALLPPPMPLFSCSISRTPGKRSRTRSTVPSLEPLSTTITSRPRTDSRHCSSHGSAFHVTTTTETSATGRGRHRCPPVEDVLPQDHTEPREREQHGHHEEQEAARERRVGAHVQVPEEADEERLPHADPVDRERDEHHEEEERPEDDVRQQGEVDADRPGRRVDRDHSRELEEDGYARHDEH